MMAGTEKTAKAAAGGGRRGRPPAARNAADPVRENSRDDILAAAITMFSEEGFEAITLRRVATAAHVKTPTIYHFFGDKRGLYTAASLEAYRRMISPIPEGVAKDPRRAFVAYITAQLDKYDANPVLHRLYLRNILDKDGRIRETAAVNLLFRPYEYVHSLVVAMNPAIRTEMITRMIFTFLAGYFEVELFRDFLPDLGQRAGHGATDHAMIAEILANFVTKMSAPGV